MESEVPIPCQWRHCNRNALKHVAFAVRVFDAPNDIHISDSFPSTEHLDLCTQHLELIELQYVHVTQYELGACPKPHPTAP